MSQKLSVLIQRFPWVKFPTIKTKAQIRRAAAIKAARTLKRQKMAKAASARAASEAGKMGEAA
jgi:hypothetical protein